MKELREKRIFRKSADNPKNIEHLKRKKEKRKKTNTKENLYSDKKPYISTVELKGNPRLLEHLKQKHQGDKRSITQKRVNTILKHTMKTIAKRTAYNEGGVFIKNFGYFCIIRYPKPAIAKSFFGKERWLNFHTGGYAYSPVFIPIRKDLKLKEWVMERAFHPYNLTRIMSELLREGKRYKMAFSLLYNLFAHRNKTVDVLKNNNFDNKKTTDSGDTDGL